MLKKLGINFPDEINAEDVGENTETSNNGINLPDEIDATGGEDVNTEEVQEEVTQEVAETETEEVTEQVTEQVTENLEQEIEEKGLDESEVLKYLSEKLGKELNSLEDLNNKESQDTVEEIDPYIKELNEWRKKTNRPIEDWINYQKDFDSMSDLEIAKEALKLEYPNLTDAEIELEISSKFDSSDELLDDREKALRELELKKYSARGRQELNKLKSNFETPLENTVNLTQEQKADLEFARSVRDNIKQNEQALEEYNLNINKSIQGLTELPIDLGDLTINYKVDDSSKKSIGDSINTMPHWKNEDGSWNYDNITKDAAIINDFDKIVKLVYEQGLNSGKDSLVDEINNTTLSNRNTLDKDLSNTEDVKIEGLDRILTKRTLKIRK